MWKRIIGRSIIIAVRWHTCNSRVSVVRIFCFFNRIKYSI
nr:MAG TPA: hypothetical protein [Caudoviricetes sp.]